MAGTDFNDLAIAAGAEVLRSQLDAQLAEPVAELDTVIPFSPAPAPVPVLVNLEAMTLEQALRRFSLVVPSAAIWDAQDEKLIKKSAAKSWWGAEVYKAWESHEARATVREEDVQALQQVREAQNMGDLTQALSRFIYLYPSSEVWDVATRQIVPIAQLKIAIADVYEQWVTNPRRRQIDRQNLVFDPGGPWEQDGKINMFCGLPLKPVQDLDRCRWIRALLWHLCNEDNVIFTFLTRWLALPLQQPGAKLASAIIMHSDVQGGGKSLFFHGVMRKIYGEYGATLGQHQMESQYTEWRSQVLYALFEEIFSRDQKYSHIGQIKHMVTGETHRLEKKFVSSWEEANHMNAVFLSNEFLPLPIEPDDRRMLVVWPEKKLPEDIRVGVVHELANGGVQAFYGYLLGLDLGDFHTHTQPPMTEAKRRLIDFGRNGWDLFYRDWAAGNLEVPYQTCLVTDLYAVYKRWSMVAGEKSMVSREKFSAFISSKERRLRDAPYSGTGFSDKAKGTFFVVGQPPHDMKQSVWLGEAVASFRKSMKVREDD